MVKGNSPEANISDQATNNKYAVCDNKSFVYFRILEDIELTFEYTPFKDDIYKAESNQPGIEAASQNEIIKVIDWDVKELSDVQLYNGNSEPINDNGKLCFIHPSEDHKTLEIGIFGEYKCQRCGNISYIPITNGIIKEPFECFNDVCKRKGQFIPLFPKELVKPIWKPGNRPIKATSHEIYQDIYEYLKDHLILKDDEYHLMTLWIMASYLVDDFNTAPYLLFIAPKSSGKTQALNVIHELGYRAYLTVSVTGAAIFRAEDIWHITPLIDESEFQLNTDKPSESSQALYGLLNGGYKRGNNALRIEGESRTPTSFDIFGFKAIASTKVFLSTLESRSIIINMTQGMPENILIDEDRSKIIRSKLLYFRFSTLKKLKIIIPKSNSGRLTELFIPLYTTAQSIQSTNGTNPIITYDKLIDLLDRTLRSMESDRKQEELSSQEAQVVKVINDLKDLKCDSITSKTIAQELKWVDENDNKAFRGVIQKIGYILRPLGIKTTHTDKGNIIDLNDEITVNKLLELKQRYSI